MQRFQIQFQLKNLQYYIILKHHNHTELINLKNSINNGVDISGNVINYDDKKNNEAVRNIITRNLLYVRLEDGTPYLYLGVK